MNLKKIVILTASFVLLHLVFSLLFVPFSIIMNFNEELNGAEIFFIGFKTFYLALLFPYFYSVYRMLRSDKRT